ncbi:MAG: rod-binding protein [Candidatus Symbiobacter sp.]|nr:rod-binding protein [Candidatus Symbiobacter sp.]
MADSVSQLTGGAPGPDAAELTKLARPNFDLSKVKAATPQEAKKLGQDFEAMFLEEMMKPMFEGVRKPNAMFGGGHGEEVFQSLMVQQYAKSFAQRGGIGVAQQIERIALHNGQVAASDSAAAAKPTASAPSAPPVNALAVQPTLDAGQLPPVQSFAQKLPRF